MQGSGGSLGSGHRPVHDFQDLLVDPSTSRFPVQQHDEAGLLVGIEVHEEVSPPLPPITDRKRAHPGAGIRVPRCRAPSHPLP